MRADLDSVYQTLVGAFHGLTMSSGDVLTAEGHTTDDSALSRDRLPYLGFATGAIDTGEWGSEGWTDEIRWSIPARLVVQGPADDGGSLMRATLVDLMQHVRRVRGLPYDDKGLAPDDGTLDYGDRIKRGEVQMLVDRKGPHIAGIQVNGPFDSGKYVAALTFRLAFLQELDPRELVRAKVVILGMRPFDVAKSDLDTTVPAEVFMPKFTSVDRIGSGGFTLPPLLVRDNGIPAYIDGESGVSGARPRDLPRELIVNPRTASIAALATQQLSAIVIMQDDASQTVTTAASWATSNAGVAAVSAAGLVTGVAAGSATITATHLGVSATCAVTVT